MTHSSAGWDTIRTACSCVLIYRVKGKGKASSTVKNVAIATDHPAPQKEAGQPYASWATYKNPNDRASPYNVPVWFPRVIDWKKVAAFTNYKPQPEHYSPGTVGVALLAGCVLVLTVQPKPTRVPSLMTWAVPSCSHPVLVGLTDRDCAVLCAFIHIQECTSTGTDRSSIGVRSLDHL